MRKIFFILTVCLFLLATLGWNAWASRCIDIEKEVSVDNGLTWHDADTPAAAPETAVGQGVQYRLIVTNCEDADLENVTINDAELGIVDYLVGDLAASDSVEIYSDDIPELDQPERCSTAGEKENIADVTGLAPGGSVTDNDPAWIKCISSLRPCIDIEKLISVDGGSTWYDADTEAEAVEAEIAQGILYKLIVNNCGSVNLVNVAINDAELGIVNYPVGDLAAGDSVEIGSRELPGLNQPERCAESGTFENIASVSALSASDRSQVTDSDPAWVSCLERGDEGCTPGYWKQPQHEDSWFSYLPDNGFFDVFDRVITIKWSEKGKPLPILNPTLLQALQANGGGINALARHAVAALLNASNPDISYAYTVAEVIAMTQAAIDDRIYNTTKNMLREANESGCPLN